MQTEALGQLLLLIVGFIRNCRLKKGLLNSCLLNNALLNSCLLNKGLLNNCHLNHRRLNDYCLCFNRVLFVVKALLHEAHCDAFWGL